MATALDSIFDVVDQRIETLGGKRGQLTPVLVVLFKLPSSANYKQIRANINTCLENFALGIVS